MPFPRSLTGTIEMTMADSSPIAVDEVAQQIECVLDDGWARSISRIGPTVRFRGSLWLNTNVLTRVEAGRMHVEKRGASTYVKYELSCARSLTIAIVLSLGPLGWSLFSAWTWSGHFIENVISMYSDWGTIMVILVFGLLPLCGRYLTARFDFRKWLVRRLSDAFPSARVQAV
jgi:hypothetical protein